MHWKYGDMLDAIVPGDIYLVTTNSFIKKDGTLVMGRGAAKQLSNMYPILPRMLGTRILKDCGHLGEYNVGVLTNGSGISLGAFQVKFGWYEDADLDLINRSACILHDLACEDGRIWHLNYPGIGNGKLNIDDVEPLIDQLPDNVNVWRFE